MRVSNVKHHKYVLSLHVIRILETNNRSRMCQDKQLNCGHGWEIVRPCARICLAARDDKPPAVVSKAGLLS